MPHRYAVVVVPRRIFRPFHYLVPEALRPRLRPGVRVIVPLGHTRETGYMVGWAHTPGHAALKPIEAIVDDQPLLDRGLLSLSRWVADRYACPWGVSLAAILPPGLRQAPAGGGGRAPRPPVMARRAPADTAKQSLAITSGAREAVLGHLQDAQPLLLMGGSRAERLALYTMAATTMDRQGQDTLLLLPEVSRVERVAESLRPQWGEGLVVLHGDLSPGQRFTAWLTMREARTRLVLGTRSAVFAPLQKPGLIVIEEEADPVYKQEEDPRYHTRDVALARAAHGKAAVLMGGAAPSLEMYQAAKEGRCRLIRLQTAAPTIEVVELGRTWSRPSTGSPPEAGHATGLLTAPVLDNLKARLAKGEQGLLYLNRRGYSLLICRDCGHTIECPSCGIALTYHRRPLRLLCHYCSLEQPVMDTCPHCRGIRLESLGTGTEQVEEALEKALPGARIARMDRDVVRGHRAHQATLEAFATKRLDLLIGTQMALDALEVPTLTLVVVLCADLGLRRPDFRAAERLYHLLATMSAELGTRGGHLMIQTYQPSHPAIQAVVSQEPDRFLDPELTLRQTLSYPPFARLARVSVRAKKPETARRIALRLKRELDGQEVEVLGPASLPVVRPAGTWVAHLLIKGKGSAFRHAVARAAGPSGESGARVVIDVDPI